MAMYLKTIVNILVSLFTTRYVLEALGLDDFGIFGLVGSVIGLLGFLNSTMSGATQRFLSYHRKQGNLNAIFTTSIILHFLIGIAVAILLEIGGFLFLETLNIHTERMAMAHFVFHCVAAITFFSIISTPYQALINANEDMYFLSIFSVFETFAKLGIAFLLFITPCDRLGAYAVAMMVLAILMRTIQRIFCKIRYPKVIFSRQFIDKDLAKKMIAFSGWNFFDSICSISRIKGLPILVNLFFGTAMNAVFNLVSQVVTQISTFSFTLSRSSAPQIISGMADKNLEHSKILAISSCKLQLFLVSLFGIPLILNIDYVLLIWLKQVPEYLPGLCCLALLNEIMLNFSRGLNSLIEGRGYIRGYKIAMGFSNLIILPIAYILLKINHSPYSIYIALFALPIFANTSRIYFAHRHVNLNVSHYLKEISKILAAVIITFICAYATIPLATNHSPLAKLLISTTLSSTLMLIGFWLALNSKERLFAKGLWEKILSNVSTFKQRL
jgi:O-antigen/teichoic acid export membrane protein